MRGWKKFRSIRWMGSACSKGSNSLRSPTPSTPSTPSTPWRLSPAPRCASRWPPAPHPRDVRAADARSPYLAALPRLYVDFDANTSLQNEHGHTFSSSLSDGSTYNSLPLRILTGVSSMCDDVKQREIRTLDGSSDDAVICRPAGSKSGNRGDSASMGWH